MFLHTAGKRQDLFLSPYLIAHKHTKMHKKYLYMHKDTHITTYAYIRSYLNMYTYTLTHIIHIGTHKNTHMYTQIYPLSEEYMSGYWPSPRFLSFSVKHLFFPSNRSGFSVELRSGVSLMGRIWSATCFYIFKWFENSKKNLFYDI